MNRKPVSTEPSHVLAAGGFVGGTEWVIEACRCDPDRLKDLALVMTLCRRVIEDLKLTVVGKPQSHQFPNPGGVTAMFLLSESHLACHTYPEFGLATFNLYCCRQRSPWDWQGQLSESLQTDCVRVRQIDRSIVPETIPPLRQEASQR